MSLYSLAKRTNRRPFYLLPTSPSTSHSLSSPHFHGCPHQQLPHFLSSSSSSTSICSTQCEGRLRCQRGVRFRHHQMGFLNGSSLPLSRLYDSYFTHSLHCSDCQVSFALPCPISFSNLQEKMLVSKLGCCNCKGLRHGFSISHAPTKFVARSMACLANSNVSIDGFSILQEKMPSPKLGGCNYKGLGHGFSISHAPTKFIARSMAYLGDSSDLVDGFSVSDLPTKFYSLCKSFWVLPRLGFVKKRMPLKCGGQYRAFSSCGFEEDRGSDDGVEGDGVDDDDEEDKKGSDDTHESSADPEEVSRVAKVIDELFALDRNMEAVLDECGINLTHDLVVDVLGRFKHARKPAFRFFCWAGQRTGYSHDSRAYNAMLTILGKTRQFETMGSLLEEMGEKGLLTMESFEIAIKGFAAGKERKKAVGVFELMKKYGFKAGVETINCLLDALAREKLAKEAQALYDKLKSRFTPNMKTYSVLLSGWCRVKNLMEAGKIWNEMIDQGFKPDIVTHNIMLDGLLKVKKRSDAIKLFEVMKAKGPAPNVRSYTILIRDLCKHSKMREAVAYFDEMLASGCEPDAGVYTCLLTGFGNQKKMDMVYSLLKEMNEKGHQPDGRLYNALIKLMTNRRMPDDAVRIYKKMIQNNFKPTIHTYNMMMKSYFLVGNSEMGCAVWDEMVQRGCCPDENSYTVLIGGLIRHGRSEDACKFVEEMINKGMRIPQIDFNKFVSDFTRVGRPNILEELARKMRLIGKLGVSEVFARWAEMTQKKPTRRDLVDTDG